MSLRSSSYRSKGIHRAHGTQTLNKRQGTCFMIRTDELESLNYKSNSRALSSKWSNKTM